jgi:hypothetical protein
MEHKINIKIIIDAALDLETIEEITLMRQLRVQHFKAIEMNPVLGLVALQKVGMTETTTPEALKDLAARSASEIEDRLKDPNVIYEEELNYYVHAIAEN